MENINEQITEHFSAEEVTKSHIADEYKIDNQPNIKQWKNITALLKEVIEPARQTLNTPFIVNSIFRSSKVNERAKGAGSSQHLANNGAAIDLECPELTNKVLFEYFYNNSDFDQLIWEYGDKNNPDWVHVSHISKAKNRRQALRCVKGSNGNPKYIPYKK